jgi:hypothetical protein
MMAWLMMSGVAETDRYSLVSSSVNGWCFNGVHPIVLWHININASITTHNILLLTHQWMLYGLVYKNPQEIIYMI